MNLWTAIVIIVALGVASEFIKSHYKRSSQGNVKADKEIEELTRTLKRHEKRIANLETILLDQQNEKRFDDLS